MALDDENHDDLITIKQVVKSLQKNFNNHLTQHKDIDKKIDKIDNRIWVFIVEINIILFGAVGTLIYILLRGQ